jgi:DNA repair protein RecO (recombination protein O)
MQWSDDGLVLGARRHGESSVILELMTREHGRSLGLVHGGRSRKVQPVLQPGNTVHAVWRARLDEHLGSFAVEPETVRASRFIAAPIALYGVALLAALLRFLPERDPHPGLFDAASVLADHLDDPDLAPALFIRFELALLAELGFGLDLHRCAATGTDADLLYVSPRSGRAVSRAAGAPFRDRLLRLPAFLRGEPGGGGSPGEIKAGFDLTGHFLKRTVFDPRGEPAPPERARFMDLALRRAADSVTEGAP